MPPFFAVFFSLHSLAPLFSSSGALLFYVWNLLRHLYSHPFAHFLTIAQFIVSPGLLLTLPKVPLFRLFSMMLDERG